MQLHHCHALPSPALRPQILTISTLHLSQTLFPTNPWLLSSSLTSPVSNGRIVNLAYVPGPFFFINIPGFTLTTLSTTFANGGNKLGTTKTSGLTFNHSPNFK